jgi:hypothetical protein
VLAGAFFSFLGSVSRFFLGGLWEFMGFIIICFVSMGVMGFALLC